MGFIAGDRKYIKWRSTCRYGRHITMYGTQPSYCSPLFHDAETQCETTNLFDAETQCEKVLKRSIAIQTLAPHKRKTKKSKKSDSAYNSNSNISCPVATPLTPVEIKHKPSTARALYPNSPAATPPSALAVVIETDTTIPLADSCEVKGKSSGLTLQIVT